MPSPDLLDIVPEHVADPVRRAPWRRRLLRGGGDLALSLMLNGAVVAGLAGIGFPLRGFKVPEAISVDLVDHMPGGARAGGEAGAGAAEAATRIAQAADPEPPEAEKPASAKPSEMPPPDRPAPAPETAAQDVASAATVTPPETPGTAFPSDAPAEGAGAPPGEKPDQTSRVPPPPEHPDNDPRARLVEAPVGPPPVVENKPDTPQGVAAPATEPRMSATTPSPDGDADRPSAPPVQSAVGGDEAVPPPLPPAETPKPLTAEQKRQAETTAKLAAMLPFGADITADPFQAAAPSQEQGASTTYRGQVYANFNKAQDVIADAKARHLKGQAVVAFTIDDRGGLANIGVAVSSGNPAIDRAALELIRRAAPFPPPPPGAQRSFSPAIGLGLDE